MLTIQDVIFDNNATSCVGPNCGSFTHSAGAVFVGNDGDVLIQRTIFRHNMAGCVGQKCTSGPAALYIDDIGPGSSQNNAVTIENSSFFSNTGGCASVSCYQGGMMDLNAIFTITFQNVTVRSNRLVCQALDCHVDEILDIDEAEFALMDGLLISENELKCGGDSCGVDSIFVIEDAAWMTVTNSTFSENTQICVGGIYTNSEHDNTDASGDAEYACNTGPIMPFSADNDISLIMITVMSNSNRCEGLHCQAGNIVRFEGEETKADTIQLSWFDVISNSVSCSGNDCHADEILYGRDNPANEVVLYEAHINDNYLGCAGDACGVDDILDFDETDLVTVTSSSVSGNVMICVGEVYTPALQDVNIDEDDDIPACNSDSLIEFSPEQKILVSDFEVISQLDELCRESCWLDHILEIEDADPDDVTFVDVRFEGNQMICNGLDCQLFEFFNTHTIDRAFVFSETQFINNTMACYGDSCSAEEFFYIHDASWLTYTHGLFYHNEISCVGDIYTDSLHDSEGNDDCRLDYFFRISDSFGGSAILSDVHIVSSTVTCVGLSCNTDDFISIDVDQNLSVYNMSLLNNYVSCEGDATEIHSARGCDTDEFVDWDAGRLLMIRDVRVMGNVQKCDGDGTVNQTGCDTDDTFETTSSSDSLDITDLHIINNLQVCSGDQCETNHLLEFDATYVTATQIVVADNLLDCDTENCEVQGLINLNASDHGNLSLTTISGNTMTCGTTICTRDSDSTYGGIQTQGRLTFTHVTISGNSNPGPGGAVINRGHLVLVHTTIVSNTADNDGDGDGPGGGICNDLNGTGLITTTVCLGIENSIGFTPTVTIKNSLIANNVVDTTASDCHGTLTSAGYNLVENIPAGCTITGDTTGNILATDPDIGPLSINGGGTETHILHTGSPAIDAIPDGVSGCGTLYVTDQRGMKRPVDGGCEIGATENVFFLFAPIVHRP